MIYLVRHGDTEYSPTRRLAGKSDIALTAAGEANAVKLGARLAPIAFDRVWVSPLQRARRTAELAGFAERAVVEPRLREIDFGDLEGKTWAELRATNAAWNYWDYVAPNGESALDVGRRADDLLVDLNSLTGTTLIFAHSVVIRVLTARYLGLPPTAGRMLSITPGSISILEHDPIDAANAILAWNDRGHLG
ncbi:MAG TPA: histidine phosphatase family protein [Kofleriaceae bacterium]|jgi:probable phosphoglycerate mutase